MNRIIKFRGKRIISGEWVYGHYWCRFVVGKLLHCIRSTALVDDFPVDPNTVGQFTGISDSKGVEVYEGDILASHHFYDEAGREYHLHHIVKWNNEMTGWVTASLSQPKVDGGKGPGNPQLWVFAKDFRKLNTTVIGNIHDNAELITEH